MTSKGPRDSSITPFQSTSQFNILDESFTKTPAQFENKESTFSNTDEQGNRKSIMPKTVRPKIKSPKKLKKTADIEE
jgi:hypothetical protein